MKLRRSLPSAIVKRSIKLDGRKTSVGLEDGFWNAFKEIAAVQNLSIQQLILEINHACKNPNLSSAIRLFVPDHNRQRKADFEPAA